MAIGLGGLIDILGKGKRKLLWKFFASTACVVAGLGVYVCYLFLGSSLLGRSTILVSSFIAAICFVFALIIRLRLSKKFLRKVGGD